ncbi:MAG: 3'(2'),5'-bisphosphate nucleotidase CysQ [Desulfovibrio sp.]|uniref:3'(2'),5'-bisphosphate nucleotidase CysQ n=1 Tax=Desulfovibrio sp. 7SRBS1 TaxID=3378064 RepID=UPI003B3F015D
MNTTPTQQEIDQTIALARTAADRILEFFEPADSRPADFHQAGIERKKDGSPVTLADKGSDAILRAGLANIFPEIHIVSEETALPAPDERRQWKEFLLVDPLDGTKEFIAGRNEFCICIGLVRDGHPAWGLIFLPVTGDAYYGGKGVGAYHRFSDGTTQAIQSSGRTEEQGLRVLLSRSHPSSGMDEALADRNIVERLNVGGAVKFCRIADGTADLYQRFNPTMEWDTAAGQAIVEGAGGSLTALDGGDFPYNKKSLKNPGFICRG